MGDKIRWSGDFRRKDKPLIPEMCFIYSEENRMLFSSTPSWKRMEQALLISCAKCRVRVHASKWVYQSFITGFLVLRVVFISHPSAACEILSQWTVGIINDWVILPHIFFMKVWKVCCVLSCILCGISGEQVWWFVSLGSPCGVIMGLLSHAWILLKM